MPSAIHSAARPSCLRNYCSRRFISAHLPIWLVLLTLAVALVLSSVLAGARVRLERHGNSDSRVADREVSAAKLFVNAPAGLLARTPAARRPKEYLLTRAHSFNGDLRDLPSRKSLKREAPELGANPGFDPDMSAMTAKSTTTVSNALTAPAAAPATTANFDGLDFATWGQGRPPRSNGDVGPTYYVQAIDAAIGIFRKSDSVRVAAFTFNTLMSQGNFGNVCDTNNQGDPILLYDSFEDRWIITDFAFNLDGSGNITNPTASFQCIAASKTGDPVSGGWNFYSINTTGGRGDAPKLGIWPDGLYMSVNMQAYTADRTVLNPRVYAFNKTQMYAGLPAVQSVTFDAPATDFGLLPSNARLQTGTPPPGSPNYFVSTWVFRGKLSVYKFHVDWNRTSLSSFTGPDFSLAGASWPNATVPDAPSLGGNNLEVQQFQAMMQNQYTNIGGAESLWATHTVRRFDTNGFAAPRWYQVNVTGGTVAANLLQATTWDPDGANVIHRFLPSLAVDRAGDMALGYSTSSSTTKPAIKYAGRLATDALNTLGQTEQLLIQGAGTQTGNCGAGLCTRWGDYSSMTLDPDGCTFWYTNEYFAVDGLNPLTRIGSFRFPGCTPVGGGGGVSGTVTDSVNSNTISGATVALGSRTTTTNGSGVYTFSSLPAGTYPSIAASSAGYASSTGTSIVVTDDATTTQSFSLTNVATSACPVDTSQADFQTGVSTNLDLSTSPGDIILFKPISIDQQNTSLGTGAGTLSITTWGGQTFTPAVSGTLTKVDITLLCSSCSGTTPNLTLSIRTTSGGFPTGADIASATIPGFASVTPTFYTAIFASPPTLTAGTKYALVVRPVANPSTGSYGIPRSGTPGTGADVYAGGTRIAGATSGTVWSTPLTAGISTDAGFRTYMDNGFLTSGNQISGLKDANPAMGFVSRWLTLSWTTTTPANTTVQFQAAAGNSIDGPFRFVGPDGTTSTFFFSGASLSQFNGFRYLKYQASLSTTDSTVTPTLNDVTVCFDSNTPAPPVITAGGPTTFCAGGSVTLTSSSAGGNQWYLNGNPIGGATSQQYIANTAGSYTDTVTTNGFSSAPSTAITVVVDPLPATPTITPDGPTTFCAGGSVTLTSSSASGNEWLLNGNPIGGATSQTYIATASGGYMVKTTDGNNCTSAPSASTTVTVNPIPATPTITPGGPTTFCNGNSVTLTSSNATGNQWHLNGNPIGGATNQEYIATASGGYTDTVTNSGCASSPSATTNVTVNPMPDTLTITPDGPTTFCEGGSVTLTSSSDSDSGNQWYLNGNPIGGATNQTYLVTAAGDYSVTVTAIGCTSSPSTSTTVTVNSIPATPTITPGGSTAFCNGNIVTLTSSSPSGNQWYLNNNPIGGATDQSYIAAAAGNYTVIVTTRGCATAPSASTTLTLTNASLVVTTTADSGAGSLRQTIIDACDSGTISFDAGLSGQTITLTTGELVINKNLTIQGPGANLLTVQRDSASGTPLFSLFSISANVTATVSGFTLSNADSMQNGGAIRNSGTLTLDGLTLTNNHTTAGGSAIFNGGTGSVTLTNSTLSGNQSDGLAAIYNQDGLMTITNSTLTANTNQQAVPGAAIFSESNTSVTNVTNCTISQNTGQGGAVFQNSGGAGKVNLQNSIVSGNAGGDVSGINDNGNNLIGADPLLAPLGNYGGPTQTMALLPGSSAINAGANTGAPATDQRGINRDPTVDIGAFESRGFAIVVTSGSSQSTPILSAFGSPLVATVSSPFSEPVAGGAVIFSAPSSGASGTFAGNLTTATTDANNGTAGGPYDVIAGIGTGLATTSFALTNSKGNQTISVGAHTPPTATYNTNFTVAATSSSGLTVAYSSAGACTNVGATFTMTSGTGTCTVNYDQAGDGNYNAATQTTETVNAQKANQTITIGAHAPASATYNTNFTVAAASNSSLAVGYSSAGVCTNVGANFTMTSGTGTCTVKYDQAGDGNFNSTNQVTETVNAQKASQSIIVGIHAPVSATYNTNFTVAATSGSSLAVAYSSFGVCTNVGATFTMTGGTGTCSVKYDQAGDGNFNAATQVTESVTAQKASQTISVGTHAPANATYNTSFMVAATGTSGPVTYSSAGACTNMGPTFTMTGGTASCTVKYDQAGNANFNAATQVTELVTAQRAAQAITFGALGNKIFGDPDFTVSATSNSSLSVSFTAAGNCTVSGSTVHFTDTGLCTITASQAGDGNYNAATNVDRSFTITNSNQTITFAALASKTLGNADFTVSSTSDSNLAVSFAATGDCTVTAASPGTVHIMAAGSCTITASQSGNSNFNAAADVAQSFTITNSTMVTLSQTNYNVNENAGFVTITVNRTGDLSVPVTVDYATDDTGSSNICGTLNTGMESSRCGFTMTLGTLRFAATEATKTFVIPIAQDSYTEGPEVFTVNLSNLTGTGAGLASPSSSTVTINDSTAPAPNANDDPSAFVREQYHDFLNRDPDAAGLQFWINEITSCGSDAACKENKRINVSAAFFLSIEFQQTGNLVRSFYVASLNRPATNNMPALVEFQRDTQAMQQGVIVGQDNWQQTLNDNRDAFMKDFVTRAEFPGLYPTNDSPTQYVDKLYQHAGITPTSSERNDAIGEFGSASTAADAAARGRALLDVTQNATFQSRETNRSFVQMEYFGYLRRNPNDAPDGNFAGYDFWVNKLNANGGNFITAEMVKAFLNSSEYRARFGP